MKLFFFSPSLLSRIFMLFSLNPLSFYFFSPLALLPLFIFLSPPLFHYVTIQNSRANIGSTNPYHSFSYYSFSHIRKHTCLKSNYTGYQLFVHYALPAVVFFQLWALFFIFSSSLLLASRLQSQFHISQ